MPAVLEKKTMVGGVRIMSWDPWERQSKGEYYDVALICRNGHLINEEAQLTPHKNTKYCMECGAETIDKCDHCGAPIRGLLHLPDVAYGWTEEDIPKHCHECGAPYPWIEVAIRSFKEITDLIEKLKPDEKDMLKNSIDDLIVDTPRTQLAVYKIKSLAGKITQETWDIMKEIIIRVGTESAKQQLGIK